VFQGGQSKAGGQLKGCVVWVGLNFLPHGPEEQTGEGVLLPPRPQIPGQAGAIPQTEGVEPVGQLSFQSGQDGGLPLAGEGDAIDVLTGVGGQGGGDGSEFIL